NLQSKIGLVAARGRAKNHSPDSPLGLEELIKIAFENNPGILAARYRWQAAVEKYPQAKSWPDPVFSITHFPSPVETRLGANRNQLRLNQMIPGFGKLRLKGEKAARAAEMARLKYEIAVRDVVTDLKISYAELQYILEAITLTQKNKVLVERLLQIAEGDYGEGKTHLQDTLRVQSQLAQVSYDLLLLEELRRTEETRINSLLNRPPETQVKIYPRKQAPVPELNLEMLYRLAENNRHEVLLAEVETEINTLSLDLAKRQRLPDFNLGFMYSDIGEAVNPAIEDSGRDAWGVMAGLTLPIWLNKNRSAVREAEDSIQASRNTRQDRVNMTNSMVKNLFFRIRISQRLVELYEKTLIPQARKSFELSETWYRAGQTSLSEMLEVQAVWLNFELALARARADLLQNLTRLERVVGYPIKTTEDGL
ncbi:MAG: TolC family protein, partial [bacterium]|nr:TolC family protein [bacterium]